MADSFVYTSPADPLARPLIDDLIREYDGRYGDLFDRDGAVVELNRYPPEAFAPPVGNFVLLMRDGEPIGGGAFKRYDDHTAEVKRMWTRRDQRRQGLASHVLRELEAQAVRQGYARFYLTTGFRQPEAAGLYLTSGYTPLYDTTLPHDAYRHLPFTKLIDPRRHDESFADIAFAVPVIAAKAS
jgi:GNAT superfamily N-acetyltransferase